MKNALRVIAIVAVVALLYGMGYKTGTKNGININVNLQSNGSSGNKTGAVAQTTRPTTAPTTQPTTNNGGNGGNNDASENGNGGGNNDNSGIPQGNEQIAAKYNEVINAAKHAHNITIHKTSNTTIEVTDAPAMKDKINDIVQGLIKPSDDIIEVPEDWDGNGTITPGDREVNLSPDGIYSASCTPTGDGGYTMTIQLITEYATFDGTNTVNPVHHESCLSPLNLATLDISPAKISNANMTYSGATLNCTVDSKGRLTHYDFTLPMEGSGSGKLVLSISVGLKGQMVETYDITYKD